MTGSVVFLILFLIIAAAVTYIVISTKQAKKNSKETFVMKLWKKDSIKSIASSVISIICGLFIGVIILLLLAGKKIGESTISYKAAFDGVQLIFMGIFNTGRNASGQLTFGWNGTNIGDMLFKAMPLILTGLSVAVSFKTGLFNIGAPGQYLVSSATTLILALAIPTEVVPAFFVWIIAFIGGILAGALWGAIPGAFKAFLNVNEVITCIMLNWIAANVVTSLFDKVTGPFKFLLDPSSTKNNAYVYKTIENGIATPKLGLDKLFNGSQVNGGIIIAILIAVVVFIILNKTTFGYELKACGFNKNASKYAGINEKRNIILSMAIAGGLAGAGAALYYLSGNTEFRWETYQSLPAIGFNGIPVALLALNNPIGVIFSSIFMAYLDVSGLQIKIMTPYNEHLTSIIVSIIVYFSAFSLVIRQLLNGKNKKSFKKKKKETIVEESVNTSNINTIESDIQEVELQAEEQPIIQENKIINVEQSVTQEENVGNDLLEDLSDETVKKKSFLHRRSRKLFNKNSNRSSKVNK